MDSQGIKILHVTDRDAVVEAVPDHLVLHLFPSFQRLFHQDLGRVGEGFISHLVQISFVVAKSAALSAQGIGCTNNNGITKFFRCLMGIFFRGDCNTTGSFYIDLIQFAHKELPVLSIHNRLNRCSQHPHIVFLQDTLFMEGYAAVQSGLSAKSQQNAIGLLLFDYFLNKVGSDREEIYLICHIFRGLYRCNIGIDKHGIYALFPQSLQGLGS